MMQVSASSANQVSSVSPIIIRQIVPQEIHTWIVDGKEVVLVQEWLDLNYVARDPGTKQIFSQGSIIKCQTEEDIELRKKMLLIRVPEFQENGSLLFKKATNNHSRLDPETVINNDSWAFTIIDNLSCDLDPLHWAGHASLFIEYRKDGRFFLNRAHLVSSGQAGMGRVILEEDINDTHFHAISRKIKVQSETWLTPKKKGQKALDEIKHEISEQEKGMPLVPIDLRGSYALGVDRKPVKVSKSQLQTKVIEVMPDNCFTWASRKLARAGIYLYHQHIIDSAKALLPTIVHAPKSKIAPSSIYSKQEVNVMVVKNLSRKTFKTLIDVTLKVHEQLKWISWKPILSEEPYRDRVERDGNKALVAAVTAVHCTQFTGLERKYDVEKTLISVKVKGEGVRQVDVTQEIKRKLEDVDENMGRHWDGNQAETEEDQQWKLQSREITRQVITRINQEEEETCVIL